VVVDDVQHLEHRSVCERDVSHIGLPGLIREVSTKALVGARRPLLRLGGDETPGLQYPPDRGYRGNDLYVALLEVVPDGLCPGVYSEVQQLLSERHDLVFVPVTHP
jgi:hypothetical protein